VTRLRLGLQTTQCDTLILAAPPPCQTLFTNLFSTYLISTMLPLINWRTTMLCANRPCMKCSGDTTLHISLRSMKLRNESGRQTQSTIRTLSLKNHLPWRWSIDFIKNATPSVTTHPLVMTAHPSVFLLPTFSFRVSDHSVNRTQVASCCVCFE
jgi:hypothetical protein